MVVYIQQQSPRHEQPRRSHLQTHPHNERVQLQRLQSPHKWEDDEGREAEDLPASPADDPACRPLAWDSVERKPQLRPPHIEEAKDRRSRWQRDIYEWISWNRNGDRNGIGLNWNWLELIGIELNDILLELYKYTTFIHSISFTYSRRIKVRVKRSTPSSWRASRYRPQWSSQQRHCRIWAAGREDSFCWMTCSICLISPWASSKSPINSSQARRPHRQLTWRSLKRSLQEDLGSWALKIRAIL